VVVLMGLEPASEVRILAMVVDAATEDDQDGPLPCGCYRVATVSFGHNCDPTQDDS
jgi:hypothetical protein